MDGPKVFTGRRRSRRTRAGVRFADVASRVLITVGGIGTIIAVITVCVFLAAVVVPLFMPARAHLAHAGPPVTTAPVVHLETDEYRTIGLTCAADGMITMFRLEDGVTLGAISLAEGRTPTAFSFATGTDTAVLGFDDGTLQAFRIEFVTEFLDESAVPEVLFELERGGAAPYRDGMVQRTREDQFRLQTLSVLPAGKPKAVADGRVLSVTHTADAGTIMIVTVAEDAGETRLLLVKAEEAEDLFTGDATFKYAPPVTLPYARRDGRDASFLAITGIGDNVFAAWDDGHLVRVRTSIPDEAYVAEERDLVAQPSARLTAMTMLLGGGTLIAGDSRGGLFGWYVADGSGTVNAGTDGFSLIPAKRLAESGPGAVTALATTTRRRMFAAGYDSGDLRVYYMTGQNQLVGERSPDGEAIALAAVSPKEDAIIALTPKTLVRWDFEAGHPEASLSTLFAPVAYEGYPDRNFAWQSSAATDDFEPKMSLVPLIFGTLKATFYSMLFGAPLAILAAIYTSEFLDPKWKAWIKPMIEMMASLPSVVLGFLAALVIAPYVERLIPATLASFFCVPLAFLLGSYLWQMLPRVFTLRWGRHRIVFAAIFLPLGLLTGVALGPGLESLLFGSDVRAWLNGLHTDPAVGRPLGGWVLTLAPFVGLAVAVLMTLYVNPCLRRMTETLDRRHLAWIALVKFAIGAAATLGIAVGLGALLGGVGLDIRKPLPFVGSFADTYDQRNALIVGIVMGFAIIPIIYTIADDALSTVPDHLRSASLGSGATPWQTAIRIIIPTAMSGLFSALMIGLGRAVGETMIVLMAAGNTPVMSMNVFEGFRTLSANIAVELPEAPVGETHYRTLFLAALTLFAMTFVVNTVAEAVRLRFRRRAYQL